MIMDGVKSSGRLGGAEQFGITSLLPDALRFRSRFCAESHAGVKYPPRNSVPRLAGQRVSVLRK